MSHTLTKTNTDTILACRYCPMCRHVCSSEFISYKESDAPRGRAILLYNIYEGSSDYDNDTVESIYNCFLCGSCTSWCQGHQEGGYDIPELIKFARRDIVNKGLEPYRVKQIKESVILNENIYDLKRTVSFTKDVAEKEAEILYYMGQDVNFKEHAIARAVIGILENAGIDFTILKNEPSTGKELALLGYEEEAKKKALELYERIKKTGCKIIITSDPLAYDALKNDYPGFGAADLPKVKHVAEFLYGLVRKGKLKLKELDKTVTLADSEYLGRFNEVFATPRKLIKSIAGLSFKEMQWNHEKMQATGESAFYFDYEDIDIGKELGKKICKEAADIKVDYIITLSQVAKENIKKCSMGNIEVLDISELIYRLL